MIDRLATIFLHARQAADAQHAIAPNTLDARLAPATDAAGKDPHTDQLYERLKQLWESNPDMGSAGIIDHLRKFVAADGETPYKRIPTHTSALAHVMAKLKEEGGADSPIYAALNQSLGFAVVSNGILNSFMGKMRERPEAPEPW